MATREKLRVAWRMRWGCILWEDAGVATRNKPASCLENVASLRSLDEAMATRNKPARSLANAAFSGWDKDLSYLICPGMIRATLARFCATRLGHGVELLTHHKQGISLLLNVQMH